MDLNNIFSREEGYLELVFGPRWRYVSVVRGFIQNFLAIGLENKTKADQIALATSELVENAIKYASQEGTRIQLDINKDDAKLSVTIENFCDPERIKSFKVEFEKIMELDPLEAYLKKMQEATVRSDGKSQLGLTRIRYETQADLKLEVFADNRIAVKAIFDINS